MAEIRKLDQLTGWRFIAAFGVVLCHFNHLLFPGQSETASQIWKGMANFVGFFFVLSGFILAYNYQSKFVSGEVTSRTFLVARFARIYPALVFSLLIALPAFLFVNHQLNTSIPLLGGYSLGSILLIKTWLPFVNWGDISPWNGPIWSIETEFFFYLCFPFLIRPLSRLKLSSNFWVWTALAIGMVIVFGLYDRAAAPTGQQPFFGAFELFHSSPYLCIFEFIFGIVTYNIARELPEKTLQTLKNNTVWIFPLLAISYGALNVVLPTMSRFHGLPAIIFSLVILLSYTSPRSLRLLQTPTFLYLGEISYSLYLLHIPTFTIYSYLCKLIKPLNTIQQNFPPIYALLVIGTTLALAAFCMRVVEIPWRKKLRLALSQRPNS